MRHDWQLNHEPQYEGQNRMNSFHNLIEVNYDMVTKTYYFSFVPLVIYVVMFGYFFANGLLNDYFYWPYLVAFILPAIRIFLIGHWGQHLERTVSY